MKIGLIHWAAEHVTAIGVGAITAFVGFKIARTEKKHAEAQAILDKAIKSDLHEPVTLHPEVDPALCAGCGACTRVCPEGDILQMIEHRAVLVAPSKCVGHGECERACPMDAIQLVFGTKTRGMDIPRLTTNYETNVPGLYIAGELGGMGLIRNAVKQGALAAKHALENAGNAKAEVDLLIAGGGPAGLAASLMALSMKKSYVCIDQNSFGGTVANFPRQKIVMSHPFTLPGAGVAKFPGNEVSKEQLLEYWEAIRTRFSLKVRERVKFESLAEADGAFAVKTSDGEIRARKVILALGVRGSPRRLGVPGEELPKVTYNLLDPEQYQGKKVTVVGGGNAGVEAAQSLADARWNNDVHLLVRGDRFDRCNDENQRRIRALEAAGRVKIWMNASIQRIESTQIAVRKGEENINIANDFVFVFAGAELPHKFLMSLGVEIDKKFGQGLGRAG